MSGEIDSPETIQIIRKIAASRTKRKGVSDQTDAVADEVIRYRQAIKASRQGFGRIRRSSDQPDHLSISALARRVVDLSRLAQYGRDRNAKRIRLGLKTCKPVRN